MSVVVAIKDEDRVWMACDSQVSRGWNKSTLTNMNNYKIMKPKDEPNTLVGIVGSLKYQNALKVQDSFINELTRLKGKFDFKDMVKNVVPKLFSVAKEYQTSNKIKDQDGYMLDSNVLFAHKDKLFNVCFDGSVTEVDDFACIGSGEEYSIGYMNQYNDDCDDKREAIINAVRSACKSELHVNYPIIVSNTLDGEFIIIEK